MKHFSLVGALGVLESAGGKKNLRVPNTTHYIITPSLSFTPISIYRHLVKNNEVYRNEPRRSPDGSVPSFRKARATPPEKKQDRESK